MNAGGDVVVLEARNRPGGRGEQTTMADGRIGGAMIGPFHETYVGTRRELGVTIAPSFLSCPVRTPGRSRMEAKSAAASRG